MCKCAGDSFENGALIRYPARYKHGMVADASRIA